MSSTVSDGGQKAREEHFKHQCAINLESRVCNGSTAHIHRCERSRACLLANNKATIR